MHEFSKYMDYLKRIDLHVAFAVKSLVCVCVCGTGAVLNSQRSSCSAIQMFQLTQEMLQVHEAGERCGQRITAAAEIGLF